MKKTFNKESRNLNVQFTLEGDYIGDSEAVPTLNLSFVFNKNYKAYIATASYVELEASGGYFMQKWQSDWPMLRFGFVPTKRYSENALISYTVEPPQLGDAAPLKVYDSSIVVANITQSNSYPGATNTITVDFSTSTPGHRRQSHYQGPDGEPDERLQHPCRFDD